MYYNQPLFFVLDENLYFVRVFYQEPIENEFTSVELDEETGEVPGTRSSRRTRRKPQRYFDKEEEYEVLSDDDLYEPPLGLYEVHRDVFDEDPERMCLVM